MNDHNHEYFERTAEGMAPNHVYRSDAEARAALGIEDATAADVYYAQYGPYSETGEGMLSTLNLAVGHRRILGSEDALALTDDDTAETYQARLETELKRRIADDKMTRITCILDAVAASPRAWPYDEYYKEVGYFFK